MANWYANLRFNRGGLYEVRSTIKNGKVEARTYFAIDGDEMILLHGHEGKSDQDHEMSVARKRWSEYQQRKREAQSRAKNLGNEDDHDRRI